jgi:gamma-glutamyltranspeptidase/glutathione hydrolase
LACSGGSDADGGGQSPAFPDGWPFPAGARAAIAPHAMVASNSSLASKAGLETLRAGGNAVDAAVATGFALAVTYPEAGNIGGGGYMIIRMADGRAAALDYREVAPLRATREMYVGPDGQLTGWNLVGPLASGVPGAVAGMAAALDQYGTMPLSRVMEPAIRLAEEGFPVDSAVVRTLGGAARLIAQFGGDAVWLPGGKAPEVGAVIRQPVLARTLRLIAQGGARVFYHGEIADSIVREMERDGGLITVADLNRYTPIWREPIVTSYRGYTLISMPPSSSGGTTIAESLNILESLGPLPPFGSAARTNVLAQAYQLAFMDRNSRIGDPAFVDVPVAELTSRTYAESLARRISSTGAVPTTDRAGGQAGRGGAEGTETTHYSVVDSAGNAVATTTTINELYGSGVFVRGAGFFLNNEMDDFTSQPGKPNTYGLVQGEQNAIAPGKRMLSAMSPTIVLDREGGLFMVLGSRGGPRIITSVSQVLMNVIDHGMSLADALSAPRIHHQALPDSLRYERNGLAQGQVDSLSAMGHGLSAFGNIGLVIAIRRTLQGLEGMVDPRSSGGVLGY